MKKQEHKQNYMTVPAALKELEKIEMIKGGNEEDIKCLIAKYFSEKIVKKQREKLTSLGVIYRYE